MGVSVLKYTASLIAMFFFMIGNELEAVFSSFNGDFQKL